MSVSSLTVLVASLDRYLISVEDARERLGLESSDDAMLGELLIEAGSMIEHYLGRPLARQRYLESLAGDDSRRIHLSALPISPESLSIEVSDVAETNYRLENHETGQLYLSGGWPCGDEQTVDVTYYAGYLLPGRLATWTTVTAITAGYWARPTASAVGAPGLLFECTTAGTTGASEPTWSSLEAGETVTDGTVVWTARSAQALPEDISRIAWLAVRNLWDARTRPSDITRMEADGFAEYYAASSATGDLPEYVTRGLDRWRYH